MTLSRLFASRRPLAFAAALGLTLALPVEAFAAPAGSIGALSAVSPRGAAVEPVRFTPSAKKRAVAPKRRVVRRGRRGDAGAALAAGALVLGVGAIIANQQRRDRYYEAAPAYGYPPADPYGYPDAGYAPAPQYVAPDYDYGYQAPMVVPAQPYYRPQTYYRAQPVYRQQVYPQQTYPQRYRGPVYPSTAAPQPYAQPRVQPGFIAPRQPYAPQPRVVQPAPQPRVFAQPGSTARPMRTDDPRVRVRPY